MRVRRAFFRPSSAVSMRNDDSVAKKTWGMPIPQVFITADVVLPEKITWGIGIPQD